tara:strand:- start:32 stop:190 length:159 start_codon:yes stop_codon:yes gene_type:complete
MLLLKEILMLIAELRIDELDDVEGPSDEELQEIEEEESAEEMLQQLLEELYG